MQELSEKYEASHIAGDYPTLNGLDHQILIEILPHLYKYENTKKLGALLAKSIRENTRTETIRSLKTLEKMYGQCEKEEVEGKECLIYKMLIQFL